MPKLEQAYFAGSKPSQEELLGFRKLFSRYENAALSEDQIVTLAQNAKSQNLDLASELGQDYYQNKLAQQITNQRKNLGTEKYYTGDLGALGGIDSATQYMASRLVLSGIRDISEIGEKTQKALGPDYSNIPQAQQDFADWYKAGGYKGQDNGSVVNYNGKKYYLASTKVGSGYNFEGSGEDYYEPVLIPINPIGEQEKVLYNKRTGEQLKQGHDVGYAYANTSISPDNPNARYTIGGTFAGNNTGLNISMVNGVPMFYTTPGPSSAFISKASIGPVLAIASMMVPGLGIAIGSTITGALGVTVSSAVAGAIGTGVLTTIASGGDVKKGAIAAATSYFVPQIAGEIGDAAGNIFESAAGKKLVENISAAALRTAALGGNADQIESAVLGATAGGLFDVVVNNLPGFGEITDPKTRAAVVASVQNALDAPGDLSNKFQAAALSGATTLGLSKIDIDGKKFSDLTPGQQSIVTTALGRELAGKPLTSNDIFKTVIDAVSKEVRADIQKERQPAKPAEVQTQPVTKAEIAAESDAILASGEDALAGLSDKDLTKGFSTEVTSDELDAIRGSDKAADLGLPSEFEDIQDTEFLFPDRVLQPSTAFSELFRTPSGFEELESLLGRPLGFEGPTAGPERMGPFLPQKGIQTEPVAPVVPALPGAGPDEFFDTSGDQDLGGVLSGKDVTDLLSGGTSNDTVAGEPSVQGGAGNDLVVTDEDGSTITFTPEGDVKTVTDVDKNVVYDADSLIGGGGNDTVTPTGGDGNDTLAGKPSDDVLFDVVDIPTPVETAPVETDAQRITREAAEAEALDRVKYEDFYTDIFPDFATYKAYKGNADAYRADQAIKRVELASELGFPNIQTFDFYKGDINRFHQDEAEYLGFPDVGTYLEYAGDFKAYDDDQASAEGWPDAATRDEFNNDKARYAKHLADERALDAQAETMTGGAGTDTTQGEESAGEPQAGNVVLTGEDGSTVTLSPDRSVVDATEADGSTSDDVQDVVDKVISNPVNIETVVGPEGDDTLSERGDDLLGGGAGNDTLFGSAGDETAEDGEGEDTPEGGKDTLVGGEGEADGADFDEGDLRGAWDTGDEISYNEQAGTDLANAQNLQSDIDALMNLGGNGTDTQPGFGFEVGGDQTGRGAYTYVDDEGNVLIIKDDGTMYLTDPDGDEIDLGNISTKLPLLKPEIPQTVNPPVQQPPAQQPPAQQPPPVQTPDILGILAALRAQQAQLAAKQKAQQEPSGPGFSAIYANIPGYKPFDLDRFSSNFYGEE